MKTHFDIDCLLTLYRKSGAPLSAPGEAGLRALAANLANDTEITDPRWAAYMLATVRHECADRWLPIEEFGRGAGRTYGQVFNGRVYYGRGYVQLTWRENYLRLGRQLGLGSTLEQHPEKVLEPEVAYRIMSFGMRTGSFTGKKLADYINSAQCDYLDARRIINGTDRADRIAAYARTFQQILEASAAA